VALGGRSPRWSQKAVPKDILDLAVRERDAVRKAGR
jgi:hypothetical protein